MGEHVSLSVIDDHEVKYQCIGAQPVRQLAHGSHQQPKPEDAALPGELRVLEPGPDEIGKQGNHEGPAPAEKLVLITRIEEQLVAQVLDVEQVGPLTALHVSELRME